MGLPLRNPTDSMGSLTEGDQALTTTTTTSQPRISPKQQQQHQPRHLSPNDRLISPASPRQRLRDRQGTAMQAAQWLHRYIQPAAGDGSPTRALPIGSPRRMPRSRLAWTAYVQEGVELGAPPLAPEPHRLRSPRRDRSRAAAAAADGQTRRPPSLERQDAFSTGGTGSLPRPRRDDHGATDERDLESVEAEDVADLYELGLLYDDDHLRGAGFGFEALAGRPYTIDIRRAGQRSRPRRRKAPPALSLREFGGSPCLGRGHTVPAQDGSLRPLNSFSDGLANFLIAPDADELGDDALDDDFDMVSVPDAATLPDLVFDSQDTVDDDCRSSDWVLMSDSDADSA